jgi:hypothetical protein
VVKNELHTSLCREERVAEDELEKPKKKKSKKHKKDKTSEENYKI